MGKSITYTVGTLSGTGVTWQTYGTKREATAAIAGALTVQKVAPRTYVIKVR